jgi:hypothetical protein
VSVPSSKWLHLSPVSVSPPCTQRGGGQHSLAGQVETIWTTGEKTWHSVYFVKTAVKHKQSHTRTPFNIYQPVDNFLRRIAVAFVSLFLCSPHQVVKNSYFSSDGKGVKRTTPGAGASRRLGRRSGCRRLPSPAGLRRHRRPAPAAAPAGPPPAPPGRRTGCRRRRDPSRPPGCPARRPGTRCRTDPPIKGKVG